MRTHYTSTPSQDTWDYAYDDDERIISTRFNKMRQNVMSYDELNNVVSGMSIEGNFSYEFDTPYTIRAFTKASARREEVIYDNDGFVTRRGERGFAWLSNGLLSESRLNNLARKFVYDHKNRLIGSVFESSLKIQFFYTDVRNPNLVSHFIEPDENRLTRVYYDAANRVIALKVMILGSNRGSKNYFVLQGNSVSVFFDESGELVKRVDRGTFGEVVSDSYPQLLFPFDTENNIIEAEAGIKFIFDDNEGCRIFDFELKRFLDPKLHDLRSLSVKELNPYQIIGGKSELTSFMDPTHWLNLIGFPTTILKSPLSPINPKFPASAVIDSMQSAYKKSDSFFHTINTKPPKNISPMRNPIRFAASAPRHASAVIFRSSDSSDLKYPFLHIEPMDLTRKDDDEIFVSLFNNSRIVPYTVGIRRSNMIEEEISIVKEMDENASFEQLRDFAQTLYGNENVQSKGDQIIIRDQQGRMRINVYVVPQRSSRVGDRVWIQHWNLALNAIHQLIEGDPTAIGGKLVAF